MKEDQEILDEIVVVGYGTKRKGSIAAAVTTIGTEDIARTTSSTVSGALVGKIAGITTRQSRDSRVAVLLFRSEIWVLLSL